MQYTGYCLFKILSSYSSFVLCFTQLSVCSFHSINFRVYIKFQLLVIYTHTGFKFTSICKLIQIFKVCVDFTLMIQVNTSSIAQTETEPYGSFLFACPLYYCKSFHTYFIIKACLKCGAKVVILHHQTKILHHILETL